MNAKQILGLAIVVVSVLGVSTTQLTELFGPNLAKQIGAACIILNGILGGSITIIAGNLAPEVQARQLSVLPAGQDAMVRSVLDMKGVEKIDVNKQANPTLAKIAVDPNVDKIAPTLEARTIVENTAKRVA